jgi:hypothetical protein
MCILVVFLTHVYHDARCRECKVSNGGSGGGIMTCFALGGSGFKLRWRQHTFYSSHPSRQALVPNQLHVQWTWGSFPGVSRLGYGADHPPAPSVEVYFTSLCVPAWHVTSTNKQTNKLRGFSPRASHTDRAAAAGRRS